MIKLNQFWIKDNIIYEKVYQELIGEDPNTLGYCDDETHHIYLKLNMEKFDELDTLIHELLHAVCIHNKIKLRHQTQLDPLATAITKFLILNNFVKKMRK